MANAAAADSNAAVASFSMHVVLQLIERSSVELGAAMI
jgi:hypothetical protein